MNDEDKYDRFFFESWADSEGYNLDRNKQGYYRSVKVESMYRAFLGGLSYARVDATNWLSLEHERWKHRNNYCLVIRNRFAREHGLPEC